AGALLGDPRLLLVDDPLAPLSPAERRRYAAVVAELVQDGVAVVATARDAAALGVLPVTATVALHAGRVVARAPTVKSLEIDVASAPFAPADGKTVRLYTCGPTVYNPAHLGNFRTFLFEDLLRRVLRLRGWGVEQVMNITDVDDKIITRAAEQGVSIGKLTAPVIDQFHEDREYLRIQRAEHYPRATAFIPQMVDLVRRLEEKGVAYQADDGSV